MAHLNLNNQLIEESRLLAKDIIKDIRGYIDLHTTTSVERAILRMLGIDGVNPLDVPLVNVVVDAIKSQADLSKGVAHYMGYLIHDLELSPQDIAIKIANNEMDLKTYSNHPKCPYVHLLDPYLKTSMKRIQEMTQIRLKAMEKEANKDVPYLYVIVATGNIYEDIKQAQSAAIQGADIIAVIRSTGQSLLDYVPYGATTEGFGGTYATQENFQLMRKALDDVSDQLGRYVRLVNYASGLCMPEIAVMGALERLDMMLNDALYGIIFRDINMKRTLIDQYFSRVISAYSDMTINTGEDNYLTTADAFLEAHTVLASQFINEAFAKAAHMKDHQIGLGHAYEINPEIENSFLYELAQASLAKQIFPNMPLKYMPPTKHITGDIFDATVLNTFFNIATVMSDQTIHLLGMMTEAIHTPFLSDRAQAIKNALRVQKAFKSMNDEIHFKPGGIIEKRANQVLEDAHQMLHIIHKEGLFETLNQGRFAEVKRRPDAGKGFDGVYLKHDHYQNPVLSAMINRLEENSHDT